MSWLDSLSDIGSGIGNFLSSNKLVGKVLTTAVAGVGLSLLSKSITKSNDAKKEGEKPDPGQTIKAEANTENKIPVLYGRRTYGGQLVDVRMSNSNQRMTYVYALSERTGNVISTGLPSTYQLHTVYWSGYKINFQADGITAANLEDLQGQTRDDINGLVKVWFYAGNSATGQQPVGYSGTTPPAWTVVPDWTASWQMTNLVFAVVEVNYNRSKSITGIGTMTFDVENSMSQPGDVMYDYMTNTRYGAAIDPVNIKVS